MSMKKETITNDDINSVVMESTKKYLEHLNRKIKRVPDYVDFRIFITENLYHPETYLFLSSYKNSCKLITHRFNLTNPETGEIRQKDISFEILPEYFDLFKMWFKDYTNNKNIYSTENIVNPIVNEYLTKKKQKKNFHRNYKTFCRYCERDDFQESEIEDGSCIGCKEKITTIRWGV